MNYYACPDCGRTEGHMHALRCGARDTMVVSPQTVEFVDGFAKEWSKLYPVNIRGQDRNRLVRKKLKPLSPRRAREFRDRWCKRMFGDRKARAERWQMALRTIPTPMEVVLAHGKAAVRKLTRARDFAMRKSMDTPPTLAPVDYATLETARATLESTPA